MAAVTQRLHIRQPRVEDQLPEELPPFLRRIYLNRGVGDATQLELGLDRLLSYHRLKGIEAAACLLADHIQAQKHILIVGDFDADGATSTALAMTALARFGASHVSYLVPDRFKYGYGLTPEIVALAQASQPDLIVTVDNGISSLAGVQAANEAGIQVLVTDHHLPGADLPQAAVIVNPNQPGCAFPSKSLAGVGVIFYVMAALRAELKTRGSLMEDVNLAELLDLVALGTVADVVPLDHNNRIMVAQGLRRIRHGHGRPGIAALARIAGRDPQRLTATDLAFFLGPRLNAAGRLEDMSIGIECLCSAQQAQAEQIARQLHELNAQRREIQDQMQAEAMASLENIRLEGELPYSLCLFDEGWHEGIVGLVASKVKERYHRPVIAFAPSNGQLKGSARSIPGLHIRDALDAVAAHHPGLISKFGGHAMAAGLSLDFDAYKAFSAAFEEEVRRLLSPEQLQAVIESDGELAADDLGLAQARALAQAGPWGQHYPEPSFHGQFEILDRRIVGERHLKMTVCHPDEGAALDAIAFNAAGQAAGLGSEALLVYRLDVNEYRGRESVQLIVEHLQPVGDEQD